MVRDKLLVLDDSSEIAQLIGDFAGQAGFDAYVTSNIDAFHQFLDEGKPSVIVLDLQMPKVDGIEVLRRLAGIDCGASILLVSGVDRRTVLSAERYGRELGLTMLGAEQKPFEPDALIERLKKARSLTAELTADDLEDAMQTANIVLRFQPVVRRISSNLWHAESVEALPRWQHPMFGLLSPAEFLPLLGADCGALMRRFTEFVMEHGVSQLQRWQQDGLHMGLRVNVPAAFLSDTGIPDRLARLFDEFESDLNLLTLELSETAGLLDTPDGTEILTRLRLKGVYLALDDFGDADTSLIGVTKLPLSEVKLDPTIVKSVASDAEARTLCAGLIKTLHQLDIECCAEGVETVEQLDALGAMEIDLVQGFFLGTPMPAREIPKAAARWTVEQSVRRVAP